MCIRDSKYSDFDLSGSTTSQFSDPITTPSAENGFGLYQAEQVQPDPYAAYNPAPQPEPVSIPEPQPAPTPTTGPPLPATGLPEGWTMEQWQYYGEQYLATQTASQVQPQPTITDTTSQSATNSQDNVWDDLDL